jgi:hypothetical protein
MAKRIGQVLQLIRHDAIIECFFEDTLTTA